MSSVLATIDPMVLGAGIALVVVIVTTAIFFATRKAGGAGATKSGGGAPAALDPREYRRFRLVKKTEITHNTINFRFALPTPLHRLGLPVGKHMSIRPPGDDTVMRQYTPVTSDDERGYFELVIKVYPTGKMSQFMNKLQVGDYVEARGPMGMLEYKGNGNFSVKRKNKEGVNEIYERKAKRVGMIAGGTGITPMLQIVRDVLKHEQDRTQIRLVFGNITEEDILLRPELDQLAAKHSDRFQIYYTLDKPSAGWTQGSGFVTKDMIKAQLPGPSDDVMMLVCGPPGMVNFMQKNFDELGYTEDMVFKY